MLPMLTDIQSEVLTNILAYKVSDLDSCLDGDFKKKYVKNWGKNTNLVKRNPNFHLGTLKT